MSRITNRATYLLSGLLAGAAAVLTSSAVAQQVTSDEAWGALESKGGAPPVGTTPIAVDIPRGPGSLTGIWFNIEVVGGAGARRTADSGRPPLQPAAAAVMKQRLQDEQEGHPYASTKSLCLPNGIFPTLKKNGLKIIEQPNVVTILVENMNHFRQIFLNAPHNEDAPASLFGDSVGHWEGDTLVVDTTNFDPQAGVLGDIPQSDEMHVVERFRRVNKDTLEYIATIDDPKTLTKSWTMPRRTLLLRPEWNLVEYICTNQRNAPDASGRTSVQLEGNR